LFDNERKPVICDRCRVRRPWEHCCHGDNAHILVFVRVRSVNARECNLSQEEKATRFIRGLTRERAGK